MRTYVAVEGLVSDVKLAIRRQRQVGAFTLIELLICISIIAILAALLLPILGRAVYRARLVSCMNSMRQSTIAATLFAGEHGGNFPRRNAIFNGAWGAPECVKAGSGDDRALWLDMGLNDVWCPFNKKIDTQRGVTWVKNSYAYYFSYSFSGAPTMSQLTEPFSYGGEDFDILVSDLNIYINGRLYRSAHPDRYGTVPPAGPSSSTERNYYMLTVRDTSTVTGPVDLNFGRIDGSVFTKMNVTQWNQELSRVPYKRGRGVSSTRWRYLPEPD